MRELLRVSKQAGRAGAVLLFGAGLCLIACKGDETRDRHGTPAAGGAAGPALDAGSDPFDDFGNMFGIRDAGAPTPPFADAAIADASVEGGAVDPDDDGCGSVVLQPMVNTVVERGNVLVVFDNSGSMTSLWGDTPRWRAAGQALRDAVASIAEYLTVGAIVFPTDGNCAVAGLDSGEQIPLLPGPTFLAAWDNFLDANAPSGNTPLGGGLIAVDAALQANELSGMTSVLVVTDGAPNCDTTSLSTLPPAWLAQGIRTHVVGLPGSDAAVAVLDDLAMAGGTLQHLTPDDPRALRRQLANIVTQTVTSSLESCTIPLDPPAPNPDDVHVVVTEDGVRQDADRDLGAGGGWTIDGAGTAIELFGAFCEQGLAGAYERIAIEFGCVELPPLPPPMGPD